MKLFSIANKLYENITNLLENNIQSLSMNDVLHKGYGDVIINGKKIGTWEIRRFGYGLKLNPPFDKVTFINSGTRFTAEEDLRKKIENEIIINKIESKLNELSSDDLSKLNDDLNAVMKIRFDTYEDGDDYVPEEDYDKEYVPKNFTVREISELYGRYHNDRGYDNGITDIIEKYLK